MLSQFWFGFAAAAVLICVCVGALFQKGLRTIKGFWMRGALWSALVFCVAQTAAAWAVESGAAAGWVVPVLSACSFALAPFPAVCLVMSDASRVRDTWWKERKLSLFLPVPALVSALACAGCLIWSLTGAESEFPAEILRIVSTAVTILYAAAALVTSAPVLREHFLRVPRKEEAAGILCAVCVIAGAVFALCTPAGTAALALGTVCGAAILFGVGAPPTLYDDRVTRIYSRAAFEQVVRTYFEENRPFTCTAVVIPQLALLESASGEKRGGELLRDVSSCLRKAARRSAVYRVDDAVFVIVDKGFERREQMMAQLETRFEQPWKTFGRMEIRFVKLYAPQDCTDAAGLLRVLKELSGRAAKAGSPMLLSCDDAMQAVTARRKAVAAAFAAAVADDSFEVVFQPVYTPRVHQVTAAKAYARLTHDELGEITDEELRFAARELHEELRFGTMMFERACGALRSENVFSTCVEEICFALTPRQWMRSGLADELAAIARKYELDLKRFVFEAPEECIREEGSEFFVNTDRLFAFGSRYALSGFGTSECNLVRLLSLDVRTIKLDKELVWAYCRGETTVPDYLAPLFASKGKRLIAEGIETKRHADAMTKLGCTSLQGYYYARPMPASDLVAYVSSATSAWEHFVREHEEHSESEPDGK